MSGTPVSNVNNIHVHSMIPEDQKNITTQWCSRGRLFTAACEVFSQGGLIKVWTIHLSDHLKKTLCLTKGEFTLHHNVQRHLGQSEDWIFDVMRFLSHSCPSIRRYFKRSVDTLIFTLFVHRQHAKSNLIHCENLTYTSYKTCLFFVSFILILIVIIFLISLFSITRKITSNKQI